MSLLRAMCWLSATSAPIADPLEPPVLELGGPAIPASYLGSKMPPEMAFTSSLAIDLSQCWGVPLIEFSAR